MVSTRPLLFYYSYSLDGSSRLHRQICIVIHSKTVPIDLLNLFAAVKIIVLKDLIHLDFTKYTQMIQGGVYKPRGQNFGQFDPPPKYVDTFTK